MTQIVQEGRASHVSGARLESARHRVIGCQNGSVDRLVPELVVPARGLSCFHIALPRAILASHTIRCWKEQRVLRGLALRPEKPVENAFMVSLSRASFHVLPFRPSTGGGSEL